jgi:hypothetical protein
MPQDPRVIQAFRLLQASLGPGHDTHGLRTEPMPYDSLLSSTDLISPWYPQTAVREPAAGSPDASGWDAYFGAAPNSFRSGLATLAGFVPPSELSAPDAEAVIDSLHEFVLALGRADVPSAMQHVAPDYHSIEGDREVSHEALRHQLESLLDERSGQDIDVALTRAPEPFAHPLGVLVEVTLRIDSRRTDTGPSSLLWHRIAVFEKQADDRWRLVSLSPASPS